MENKTFLKIVLRIVLLGASGILFSYVPENLTEFFGDTPCLKKYGCGVFSSHISWGNRHYWYFWTCFLLFILSLINSVIYISKAIGSDKNIKNL